MTMEVVIDLLEIEPKESHRFELFTLFFRERCSWSSAQDDLTEIVRNGLVAAPCPVLDDASFGIVDPKSEGSMTDWRGGLLPCPAEWFLDVFFFVHGWRSMALVPLRPQGEKPVVSVWSLVV